MTRVVIESPFGDPDPSIVRRNIRYLRRCLRDSLLRGEAPYASHAIYTLPGVLDDNDPAERRLGMDAGFAWGLAAERVVVYSDLGISGGMAEGIALASCRGIPVEYREIGAQE